MNTWCAGAPLTTRSKRGSAGLPAAFGISALRGGSSASRTATDWFDAACLAALSISATMLSSTLYGPAQETSKAVDAMTLIRFMGPLLTTPWHLGFLLGGGPALRAPHRRIELDGFGRFGSLQDDLLVADPHQGGVAVTPAQTDRAAVDRRLAAVFGDDHHLRGRRTQRRIECTRAGTQGRASGIVQALGNGARRAELDDERETQRQMRSHVFSGLRV